MSLIQKFSIKRINKIRKILLLYIDKDLKFQQKNKKQFDCFTRKFNDKSLEKMYSAPINIQQYYSNISQQNNVNTIVVGDLSFDTFSEKSYMFNLKSYNSNHIYGNNNIIKGTLSKKTVIQNDISENIINKLLRNNNERKHINKSEKSFVVIKDNKIKLKKQYLINLARSLKNAIRRKKCLSTMKIVNKRNKNIKTKEKKTILEVKRKQTNINIISYKKDQKTAFGAKRSLSTIDKKDLNLLIKRQKRRSLFFKKK